MLFDLNLGVIKPLLQNESTECGLVCLAMIANFHGNYISIREIRDASKPSARGLSLSQLSDVAKSIGLSSRPLKLELENLADLSVPCILHWNLNHYVVLKKVTKTGIVILDPAVGERFVDYKAVDHGFSGIALELLPTIEFKKRDKSPSLSLYSLVSQCLGLKKSLSWLLTISLLLNVLAMLLPIQSQIIIDDILSSGDQNLIIITSILFGFLVLSHAITAVLRSFLILSLSNSIGFQISTNLFSRLLSLPIEFFARRQTGDIVSRFVSADRIRDLMTSTFIETFLDGVFLLVSLLLMFSYSTQLTLISLLAAGLYSLTKLLSYRHLHETTNLQLSAIAKRDSTFLESIRNIVGVKLFGGEVRRAALWQNHFVQSLNASNAVGAVTIWMAFFNQLISGSLRVLVVAYGAHLVLISQLTLGMLIAFIAYMAQFIERSFSLIDNIQKLALANLHIERISDIALTPIIERRDIQQNHSATNGRLRIENLEYRHGTNDKPVFQNLNLEVECGESVAIVGLSGSGKSTLVKCIAGLLQPSQGEIFVDDCRAEFSASLISAVLQDDHLFAGTILENITFFDEVSDFSLVQECAQVAGILPVISVMPLQFHTNVGDMGSSLSAGQVQRIMIARALYRKPRILILDESTSHLDIGTERFINSSIKKMNITRIIIAHRPETILSADRILSLENTGLHPIERDKFIAVSESHQTIARSL
jgi:ATP-binding cassette, subfamily B, bacterial CvaB/MchF/RaxB